MSDYHATYTVYAECNAGSGIRLATRDTVRAGNSFQGAIQNVPGLGEQFVGAVLRAGTVSLNLALNTTDPVRAQVLNLAEGQVWTITTVCTRQKPGQAITEIVHSRALTMTGLRINGALVVLSLADIEDKALEALHPPLTWTTDEWPALSSSEAGGAIPDPVGIALHVNCPLLDADTDNDEWFYGVCTGEPVTLPVIGVDDIFSMYIVLAGDQTALIKPGDTVYWDAGSSDMSGRYTVDGVMFSGGNTEVLFHEPWLAGVWAGSTLRLMPRVLTVYRNGRVVPRGEFEVVHTRPLGPVINGDFETGDFTGWYVHMDGIATSPAVAGGVAEIAAFDPSNYAEIRQQFSSSTGIYHAAQVECVAGGAPASVELFGKYGRRVAAGTRRTCLVNNLINPAGIVWVGVWNKSGTTRVDNIRLLQRDLVLIRFTSEQRDFQGSLYTITADIEGLRTRNAVREIQRLLTLAGVTIDTTSFNAAAAYADTHRMLVDCDYGRDGQRTLRAILDDLCFIARATLSRNSAGHYVITQDRTVPSLESLDTSVDAIALDSAQWCPQKPKTVSISYRPGAADPDRLQHTIDRDVPAGSGGVQRRAVRYLRDHEAADRLLCYIQRRAEYARTASLQRYHETATLGAGIELSSPLLPLPMPATTWRMETIPQGWRLELREYDAAIHTYVPGTLPSDATPGYAPDYSRTPPLAPTALSVTGAASAVAADGTITARVSLQCTAPAVNWEQIWFAAVHNVTGEIIMAMGTLAGSLATVTLTGLRPGEGYQIRAWAVNAFGLRGPSMTVSHTASGHAALPPDVAWIVRNQGTGRLVNVNWAAVAISNLREYVLERSSAGGAFTEVWRGRAVAFVDRDIVYGVIYAYRVKAVDTYGNLSANWRTSSNITTGGNVSGGSGGDIGNQTVGTINRTNVSSVSSLVTFNQIRNDFTLTHSLGRVPLATAHTGGGHMVSITGVSTTTVNLSTLQAGWGLTSVSGAGVHTHDASINIANKAIVLEFW